MGFAWYTNQNSTGGMVQVVAGTVNDTTSFSSPVFTVNATAKALAGVNYNVASNGLKALTGMADSLKRKTICQIRPLLPVLPQIPPIRTV